MARNVGRFLRASWERSVDSAGRVDLIIGLVVTLVGRVMNLDLALQAAAVVLAVLLVRVLLLSPASMWAEDEAERQRHDESPFVGRVEAGGVVNINYFVSGPALNEGTATATASDTETGAAVTSQSVVVNDPPEPIQ